MNSQQAISIFLFFFLFDDYHYVSAQSPPPLPPPPYGTNDLFKPSLAIITGAFSIVFTLSLFLLVYAKCFHNDLRSETEVEGDRGRVDRLWERLFNRSSRFSGLDKTSIESLPFFRFSDLKGSKQGLECCVCLSKFEEVEILRLLPKCRHAFHIGCIDQWLEQQATCPLCRNRVSIEDDVSVLGCSSNSLRIMNESHTRGGEEDSSLEIYIEREEGSSRFSSFRKILQKSLFLDGQGKEDMEKKEKRMHKFNHRIFVSDAMFKNRWSNVTSSDLTFLTSEMLNSVSSDRFQVQRGNLRDKEYILKNKDTSRRVVSEITTVPRENVFGGGYNGSTAAAAAASTSGNNEEERRRRLWLPIARRTAQWFVNREKTNEVNTTRQSINV